MATTAETALTGVAGNAPERRLTGRLGVGSIVFMVVAAAAPLTVIGGGFPLAGLLGNGVGAPSMFAVGGLILLFFSVGLATMSKYVAKPGAFFTYVGYGVGRPAGLAAAWLAMLTYTAVQVAVYGYLGAQLQLFVVDKGGPDITWWAYALAAIAVVGILGYRHVELSAKVLGVLLIAEVGITLLLSLVVVGQGGEEGLSVAPFEPSHISSGSPALGLMFALAGFIGFESTAIFRDEARDPERTIPRATYAAVILIAVFYTFTSWALVMGTGPSGFVEEVGMDPAGYIMTVTGDYLGSSGADIVNLLLLTSLFACVLSFHNVITRYQHSMSHATVMPGRLGAVHPRHQSPHLSSFVQTGTALTLIAAFALFGLDPVLEVFTWFSGIATFAIVGLMALTCLAVIVYFVRNNVGAGLWKTTVAPGIGLVGLLVAFVILFKNFPLLISDVDALGAPVFGGLTITFLVVMAAFPVFGLLQAYLLKSTKPEAYASVIDTISE